MTGELICIEVKCNLAPNGKKIYSARFGTPKSQLNPVPILSQIATIEIVSEDELSYKAGSYYNFSVEGEKVHA